MSNPARQLPVGRGTPQTASPALRARKLERILAIVVAWTVAGLLLAIYEELSRRTLLVGVPRYPWGIALAFKTMGTTTAAMVAGPLVVLVLQRRLVQRPVGQALALQALVFASIAVAVGWLFGHLAAAVGAAGTPSSDIAVEALLKAAIFSIVLGALTSVGFEVQDRVGHGAFLDFLLGPDQA